MKLVLEDLNLTSAERLLVVLALEQSGSIVEAAKLLGITRHALKRRIIKHGIRWRLAETSQAIAMPANPIAVRPLPLPKPRPHSSDDARTNALRVFSWFAALAPPRVWREEVAGALHCIEIMQRNGCARWQIGLKVCSTIFWVLLNGIREVVAGLTGRK